MDSIPYENTTFMEPGQTLQGAGGGYDSTMDRTPDRPEVFFCDAMLGGLARWLRAFGYDARYEYGQVPCFRASAEACSMAPTRSMLPQAEAWHRPRWRLGPKQASAPKAAASPPLQNRPFSVPERPRGGQRTEVPPKSGCTPAATKPNSRLAEML